MYHEDTSISTLDAPLYLGEKKKEKTCLGNIGPLGIGLSSSSKAILVAAWIPYKKEEKVEDKNEKLTKSRQIASLFFPSETARKREMIKQYEQTRHGCRSVQNKTKTHLNPINDSRNVPRLEQKLFSFHPDSDHVLPLQIIARQPTLGVLQRVLAHEVLRIGFVLEATGVARERAEVHRRRRTLLLA